MDFLVYQIVRSVNLVIIHAELAHQALQIQIAKLAPKFPSDK